MTAKVLVATALAPHKAYCLDFLQEAIDGLAGIDRTLLLLDDVALPDGCRLPGPCRVQRLPEWNGASGFDRFAHMREAARRYFLEQGDWTHLYFHDADIIPPRDIVPALLGALADHAGLLATGLYCLRGHSEPVIPVGVSGAAIHQGACMMAEQLGGRRACGYVAGAGVPADNVVPILWSGLGCALIARHALEAVPFRDPDWFRENLNWGEDSRFCVDVSERFSCLHLLDVSLRCWHVDEDGMAARVTYGPVRAGAFYDCVSARVTTRPRNGAPARTWLRGVPKVIGQAAPGEPVFREVEMNDLGPSFYAGPCRELKLERTAWQEALQEVWSAPVGPAGAA